MTGSDASNTLTASLINGYLYQFVKYILFDVAVQSGLMPLYISNVLTSYEQVVTRGPQPRLCYPTILSLEQYLFQAFPVPPHLHFEHLLSFIII